MFWKQNKVEINLNKFFYIFEKYDFFNHFINHPVYVSLRDILETDKPE